MSKSKAGYYIVRYRLDDNEKISEILVFGKDAESVRKHMVSLYETVDILSIEKQ